MTTLPRGRPQTLGEEIANAISHGLGVLAALACLPVMVWWAARHGSGIDITAAAVMATSMLLLYGVSTLYHALPPGRAKRWLHRLDHAAIYVFIAGSYTPFVLGPLRGAWGWSLFGVVWGLAALGVGVKFFNRLRNPGWSTGLYVAMGWVVLVAVVPLVQLMPATALAWLVAGGLAYTLGALVFLLDHRVRYAHAVWHLFVLAGSACHVVAAMAQLDQGLSTPQLPAEPLTRRVPSSLPAATGSWRPSGSPRSSTPPSHSSDSPRTPAIMSASMPMTRPPYRDTISACGVCPTPMRLTCWYLGCW